VLIANALTEGKDRMELIGKRLGWGLLMAALLPLSSARAQHLAGVPVDSAAAAEGATAPALKAGDHGPLRIEVSVSERRLRVVQGDEVVKTYPVAVGQPKHPTPRGQFSIRRLIWNPRWVPPDAGWARGKSPREPGDPKNPMGRVKLFFSEPDYYIHGTENHGSLGQAESHGCVRMANDDVVELARLVMERGGQPRPPTWFHRILNVVRSTSEVRLTSPVTVVVTG
jgi:lipoprotein-anchoring transpeptidase ErfK/SrfK